MNRCERIRKYEGTKSQILLEMIAEKRRTEITKKIPELIKKHNFNELQKKVTKAKEELDRIKNVVNKIYEKHGVQYNYFNKKFEASNSCDCDTITKERLQNAQDMWSLGMEKKAQEVWDDVTKKHKLSILVY